MKFPAFAFLLVTCCAVTTTRAKEETNAAIDKFFQSNIERQALESDSELTKTVVKPDAPSVRPYTKSSYISFGSRKIKTKGVVVDESSSSKPEESRRYEERRNPNPINEPVVHESEPIDFVVTETIGRQEYTTETPVTQRQHHWFYPSDPSPKTSPSQRKSSSAGHSSSRTMHRSSSSSYSSPPVASSYSSSYPSRPVFPTAPAFPSAPSYSSSSQSASKPYEWSESKDKKDEEPDKRQEDNEPMPSIPEPTKPESTMQVKEGQAATRQYFYNSRWVPKSYASQPGMQSESKRQTYDGSTGFGQETQQYNKVAERGDDVLLVFAHSIEIPLIVTSPQAFKSNNNNNNRQTTIPPVVTPVVNTAAPQFLYMSSPEQQEMGLTRQTPRSPKTLPQSRRASSLTQRWGAASSILPSKSNAQVRMIPINYPLMRRSNFAYPFADLTTAASAPVIQVTPANIPANHLSRHHYPSYIGGRVNTRPQQTRPVLEPMASQRLVTLLPIN